MWKLWLLVHLFSWRGIPGPGWHRFFRVPPRQQPRAMGDGRWEMTYYGSRLNSLNKPILGGSLRVSATCRVEWWPDTRSAVMACSPATPRTKTSTIRGKVPVR